MNRKYKRINFRTDFLPVPDLAFVWKLIWINIASCFLKVNPLKLIWLGPNPTRRTHYVMQACTVILLLQRKVSFILKFEQWIVEKTRCTSKSLYCTGKEVKCTRGVAKYALICVWVPAIEISELSVADPAVEGWRGRRCHGHVVGLGGVVHDPEVNEQAASELEQLAAFRTNQLFLVVEASQVNLVDLGRIERRWTHLAPERLGLFRRSEKRSFKVSIGLL